MPSSTSGTSTTCSSLEARPGLQRRRVRRGLQQPAVLPASHRAARPPPELGGDRPAHRMRLLHALLVRARRAEPGALSAGRERSSISRSPFSPSTTASNSFFTSGLETPLAHVMAPALALYLLRPGSKPRSSRSRWRRWRARSSRWRSAWPRLFVWWRRRAFPWLLFAAAGLVNGGWLAFRIVLLRGPLSQHLLPEGRGSLRPGLALPGSSWRAATTSPACCWACCCWLRAGEAPGRLVGSGRAERSFAAANGSPCSASRRRSRSTWRGSAAPTSTTGTSPFRSASPCVRRRGSPRLRSRRSAARALRPSERWRCWVFRCSCLRCIRRSSRRTPSVAMPNTSRSISWTTRSGTGGTRASGPSSSRSGSPSTICGGRE